MLIITNGRVLVDPAMNEDAISNLITAWTKNAGDLFDVQISFKEITEPFLMYKIPDDLPWKNLIDCIPGDTRIEFMAIGANDEVQMPYPSIKEVKHNFSMEESKAIADSMCDDLMKTTKLENELKAISKRYKDQISEIRTEVAEKAQQHIQGHELRSKSVFTLMNFKERVKYYNDVDSGELVATEEMTEKDQRTLWDVKGYDPAQFEEMEGFEIGNPEDVVIPEEKPTEEVVDMDAQANDIHTEAVNLDGDDAPEHF